MKVALGLVALLVAGVPATEAGPSRDAPLSLMEARAYMLELINRDRAAMRLRPLAMDDTATAAGQAHAEEMATQHYLSHRDRHGRLPDVRYTEAGGRDHVEENVLLNFRYAEPAPATPLELEANPTFTRRELEQMEAAYFNQHPPFDSHRRNLLSPAHTHAGIGLARGHLGLQADSIGNTQELIDRYAELDPLPRQAHPGEVVTVSGRLFPGVEPVSVGVGREEPLRPMAPEELKRYWHYSIPKPYAEYREDDATHPLRVLSGGRFTARVALGEDGKQGVYFVRVRVRADGVAATASQRTVIVH